MDLFVALLGSTGIILLTGFLVFLYVFKYSQQTFDWIEAKTFGTRSEIEEKLEFLMLEIKPVHVTYILLGSSFGLGGLVFIGITLLGSWLLGLIVGIFVTFMGFKIPLKVVDFLCQRRVNQYQGQMVDGLQLLANGIRAGLSVPQAIGLVVDELPSPLSDEFNIILQQNKIGVPLEECFDNLAKRIPSEDNDMFVASINILRETGGNLAEVFDTIVAVIRERIRLQQKIAAFVAQGLFQGATIFAMPFVITILYAASDPEGMKVVFTHPLGILACIIALALNFTGGFIIMKIVKIKV